jgi:hypothetical protein
MRAGSDEMNNDDHLERLRAMIAPGQQTWDLSPKDVAAIRWAVAEIETAERAYAAMKRSGIIS